MRVGTRREEVAIGEAELKKVKADVEYLRKRQVLHAIAAPIGGQITTPRLKERLHEKVPAGGTVCELADASGIRFDIFVPERHRDIVALGQPTVVKIQSYPLRPFSGKVDFIAPAAERQLRNGEVVVRVQTVIDNREGLLHEGLTGYGEIETGRRPLVELALRRVVRWIRVRFLI
jgi:multidrug efflux pump subunit AcrA (membrane-fusion protein)